MRTFSFRQVLLIVLLAVAANTVVSNALIEYRTRPTLAASAVTTPVEITSPTVASDEQNNVEIYRLASPGVVHITSTVDVQSFFGAYPQQGTGSGSIIDDKGHILTNYHVVRDANNLDVTLSDKSTYKARLIGADPDNDIAVIQIDAPANKLNVMQLGTSGNLEVGQKVLAIGNPFGLDRTLTTGVISGLNRPLQTEDGRTMENVIQTDASINPGNSGGPLLNKFGQIIGINTAIYSPTGSSVGIGFAVPIDTAKQIIPELIASGKIRRGYLGVTTAPLTPKIAEQFQVPTKQGVVVVSVQPNSPASQAGLLGVQQDQDQLGDVIVKADGKPIETPDALVKTIGNRKPGDRIALTVLRDGRERQVEITLADRPLQISQNRPQQRVQPRGNLFDWFRK